MAFDTQQFKDLIAETLASDNLYSPEAVALLLGTAAQESKFGTYLRQIKGPALGIFQMEPATYQWMREKFGRVYGFQDRKAEDMIWDLKLSILLCRLRYLVVKEPLPKNLPEQARYWKKYYNTSAGKGTPAEYIANFQKYVR